MNIQNAPTAAAPAQPTTITGWLETLPEPHRSRAILNITKGLDQSENRSLVDALNGAFVWERTPEGFVYWSSICAGDYTATPLAAREDSIELSPPAPTPQPITDHDAFAFLAAARKVLNLPDWASLQFHSESRNCACRVLISGFPPGWNSHNDHVCAIGMTVAEASSIFEQLMAANSPEARAARIRADIADKQAELALLEAGMPALASAISSSPAV